MDLLLIISYSNNFIPMLGIRRQEEMSKQKSASDFICALKVSNFDLNIDCERIPLSTRYTRDKAGRPKRAIQNYASCSRDQLAGRQRKIKSSNELRKDSELFGDFSRSVLNEEEGPSSPVFQEKIIELKGLMEKRLALSRRSEKLPYQNVHFSEYVLQSCHPQVPSTSVLHSRQRKDCLLTKSLKVRHLNSRSRSQADRVRPQAYNSIQLNNSSKYASSKKMPISISRKPSTVSRKQNRSYLDQRQSRQQRKPVVIDFLESDEDYKPWNTRKVDPFYHEEDTHLILY